MIEGYQKARPISRGSPSSATAFVLLGVIALFALAVSPALGYDSVGSGSEGQGEAASGSIVLDVYLDADGRALLVGYLEAEEVGDLSFIESSEYIYDEETGELYAIKGDLVYGDGISKLKLTVEGLWGEYHLAFYLPEGAELLSVSCSEGLEYSVDEVEGSLAVEVLGYEVEGAEVVVDYNLAG